MARPRVGQPAGGVGIGMFAGRQDPQQSSDQTIAGDLQDSLAGDPGIRLAHSRGKRTYKAGALTPQRYVPEHGPNSESALETLPLTSGTRRRALGQTSRLNPDHLPTD